MSSDAAAATFRSAATNILLLDTTTLISILVMVVFIIKLFNNVLKSNGVGSSLTSSSGTGRLLVKRDAMLSSKQSGPLHSNFSRRRIFVPFNRSPSHPRPQIALATANLEAQRLNRAVLSYDFIYLLIAIAATLLFVFETLYRVYNLYATTNGSGRSLLFKQHSLSHKKTHSTKRRQMSTDQLIKPYFQNEDELYESVMPMLANFHQHL